MWDGNGYWDHGGGWEGWMMSVIMIVFVVAVIVAVVYLVRYFAQLSGSSSGAASAPTARGTLPESPKDILKRRYAAGEIDREEYLQKLGDL
jgi:putative membrane protein